MIDALEIFVLGLAIGVVITLPLWVAHCLFPISPIRRKGRRVISDEHGQPLMFVDEPEVRP